MVEFALVAVLLVTLVIGVIEGGLLFRSKLALSNSVDEAARRGSVAANDPTADYQILQQILTHSADQGDSIRRIVIYKADASDSAPSAGCQRDLPGNRDCNVYSPADFARPESDFGSCGQLDGDWCPTDRDTSLAGDLLGVWVDGTYATVTGIIDEVSLTQNAIVPLESSGGIE